MNPTSDFNYLNNFEATHQISELAESNFVSDLASWVEADLSSNRQDAANRIKDVFENNKTELNLPYLDLADIPPCIGKLSQLANLNLSGNELKSLPPKIGQLSQLANLNLSGNELESLPSEIGQLSQLTQLNLSWNKLESLPPKIGELSRLAKLWLGYNSLKSLPSEIGQLSRLTKLWLGYNRLKSLPPKIGQLSRLTNLNLSGNELKALPSEIGRLSRLIRLHLYNNSDLSLPLSLGQIPELIYIDIEGSRISKDEHDAILNQCKALREKKALEIFLSRLKRWALKGQTAFGSLQAVLEFEEQKIKNLNEWLVRLEKTKDFNSEFQKTLAEAVCEMLVHVIKDEDFQDTFFPQIEANLACCQDRAAMALNEIYVSYKISALENSDSLEKKLQTMVRGAKTSALRKVVAECINAYQKENNIIESETVEIYLYYEIVLRDTLDLLSIIKSMDYSEIGKRDWIDEEKLVEKVEASYLDELIELSFFEKMLESNKEYQEAYEKEIEGFQKELEELENHQLSQGSREWQAKIGALGEKQKLAAKELKKKWAKRRLRTCSESF